MANTNFGSRKSLPTLFDMCFENMLVKFGQKYTKLWAFWQKTGVFKPIFWQCFDVILEGVSVAQTSIEWLTIHLKATILQRSKYYGSPTPVTKLNVASNMADIRHSDSIINCMYYLNMCCREWRFQQCMPWWLSGLHLMKEPGCWILLFLVHLWGPSSQGQWLGYYAIQIF